VSLRSRVALLVVVAFSTVLVIVGVRRVEPPDQPGRVRGQGWRHEVDGAAEPPGGDQSGAILGRHPAEVDEEHRSFLGCGPLLRHGPSLRHW